MTDYVECVKCGSCININTNNVYIECACGAIAVDGNDYYCRIIGKDGDYRLVTKESK